MSIVLLGVLALLGLGSERSAGTRRALAFGVIVLFLLYTTWRKQLLL
jgi:hypothetical protein